MRAHVVWLVLLTHMILLLLWSGGINTLGLAVLLVFPVMVLTGVITYRAGRRNPPKLVNPLDHPSCFWRA